MASIAPAFTDAADRLAVASVADMKGAGAVLQSPAAEQRVVLRSPITEADFTAEGDPEVVAASTAEVVTVVK
jgi:hypothetical protein